MGLGLSDGANDACGIVRPTSNSKTSNKKARCGFLRPGSA
jgi:hypothetical protein